MKFIFWLKSLFKTHRNEWRQGNPPRDWPSSWVEFGMRVDPEDPKKIVSCWRKSAAYYESLI